MNMLGFDPAQAGLSQAATAALRDPADQVSGLFAALAPIEARQTAQQVSGLRDMFGSLGGRFGTPIAQGEADLRSQIATNFNAQRQQGLLQAGQMRNNALAQLMQASLGARGQASNETLGAMSLLSQFFRPGEAYQDPGILPGLLSAGASLGAAALL